VDTDLALELATDERLLLLRYSLDAKYFRLPDLFAGMIQAVPIR
jgi:hypothetical protein